MGVGGTAGPWQRGGQVVSALGGLGGAVSRAQARSHGGAARFGARNLRAPPLRHGGAVAPNAAPPRVAARDDRRGNRDAAVADTTGAISRARTAPGAPASLTGWRTAAPPPVTARLRNPCLLVAPATLAAPRRATPPGRSPTTLTPGTRTGPPHHPLAGAGVTAPPPDHHDP